MPSSPPSARAKPSAHWRPAHLHSRAQLATRGRVVGAARGLYELRQCISTTQKSLPLGLPTYSLNVRAKHVSDTPDRLDSRPSVATCHCPVTECNCMESARYDVYASQSGNSYAARGLQIVTLCAQTAGFGEFLDTEPAVFCYFFFLSCLPIDAAYVVLE